MTPLRAKMIREMELRQLSPNTQKSYLRAVRGLASHYGRSPDRLALEDVRSYLHYLLVGRKLAGASCNVAAAGVTFFYQKVVRLEGFDPKMRQKRSGRLPEVFSQEKLQRLFGATHNRKHRALLMTTYAAGLRVAEVVRLKPEHIQSDRMMIRVEQGKGNKDRYTLLSACLLSELRTYWSLYRPPVWLFPGVDLNRPMSRSAALCIYYTAKKRAGITRGNGIHTLRHCFATHLFEAKVDARTIQVLLGHKSVATTMRYLQVTRKHLSGIRSPFDLLCIPRPGQLADKE